MREALLAGEFDRGHAVAITGCQDRMPGMLPPKFLEAGLLVFQKHLRVGVPQLQFWNAAFQHYILQLFTE